MRAIRKITPTPKGFGITKVKQMLTNVNVMNRSNTPVGKYSPPVITKTKELLVDRIGSPNICILRYLAVAGCEYVTASPMPSSGTV
jgi:hypothetical protein